VVVGRLFDLRVGVVVVKVLVARGRGARRL